MNKENGVLLVCLLLLSCFDAQLFADGMMVYYVEEGSEVESVAIGEHSQQAFLYFDQNEQTERLILEIKTDEFQGGFAWIVPLPPVPEGATEPVARVKELQNSPVVFSLLAQLTAPSVNVTKHFIAEHITSPIGFGCACALPLLSDENALLETDTSEETSDWHVDVWNEGVSENFSYVQISGEGAVEISYWLVDRGYGTLGFDHFNLIDAYSRRDFSFLIVTGNKIEKSEFSSALSITFPTSVAFFPLEISKPGMRDSMELTLYVYSSQVMTLKASVTDRLIGAHVYPDEIRETAWENYGYGLDLYSVIPDTDELIEQVLDWFPDYYSLGTSFFWRESTVIAERSEEEFPFGFIDDVFLDKSMTLDGTVILSRFSRKYLDGEYLEDIYMELGSLDEFQGEIKIDVYVETSAGPRGLDDANRPSGVDYGIFFPPLFLVWIGIRKAFGRIRCRMRGKEAKRRQTSRGCKEC